MIFQVRKTNNLSNQPATSLFSTEKAKIERQTNQNFCGPKPYDAGGNDTFVKWSFNGRYSKLSYKQEKWIPKRKYNDQKRIEKTQPLEGMNCAVRLVHAWLHWLKLPEI